MTVSTQDVEENHKSTTPQKPRSATVKRKRINTVKIDPSAGDHDDDAELLPPTKSKKRASPRKNGEPEEKRMKRYRSYAPTSYNERLHRAKTQRMFVIDRARGGTEVCPEETIDLAGTTGNVYSITIGLVPSCTCPDYQKGNQCKHIVYVLYNVLKAPEELRYQLAFLSSEVRTIFASAPSPTSASSTYPDHDHDHASNRKSISGDCPICFTPFSADEEGIVFCRAACGNNIHADCFEQWARSQAGKEVRCVYCRTPWQGDEEQVRRICRDKAKRCGGKVNAEGYVNVADELGLSGARDCSTYHHFWLRQQGFGYD